MHSVDPHTGHRLPLVVLVGPTAVGKTELSIRVAEQLQSEIISADSRLFYVGMDIGTAKPTLEERQKIRHHLIDVTTPDQTWSLAVFQQAAHAAILDIHYRGKLPLLVGGTGQYIRAVLEGWSAPEVQPDPALRAVLSRLAEVSGARSLHQKLAVIDPAAAAKIDYRNVRRTIRALEVIFTTGQPFSAQRIRHPSPYRALVIGLTRPRQELYARIDARIQSMLAGGLVEEVRNLLDAGYSPGLPAFSAIGYREIISLLHGEITLSGAEELMKRQSRTFVRRQANWFKLDDPKIRWMGVDSTTAERMVADIGQWQKDSI